MLVSIIIVMLGILFGSLSIFVQYTKDCERRKKIEAAVSIPAVLALFGTISWLMSHAHHLDDLGVSILSLIIALVFFVLIPAVTYVFSPAFKDTKDTTKSQPHSQNYTTQQQAQRIPRPTSSPLYRPTVAPHAEDIFIIKGVIVNDGETYQAPRLTQ